MQPRFACHPKVRRKLAIAAFVPLLTHSEMGSAQVASAWQISGDISVSSVNANTGSVTLQGVDGVSLQSPSIVDGAKNSISASAVGSAASSSFGASNSQDSTSDASIDGSVSIYSNNDGAAVINFGSLQGALIEGGHDNSIAVSAVGSSASMSISDYIQNGASVQRTFSQSGDVSIDAENSGDVLLQTDFGTDDTAPRIEGSGIRNTISATAIGASASLSVSSIVSSGDFNSDISVGNGGSVVVTANNTGNVQIGSTDDPDTGSETSGAYINPDSKDSSIAAMAIGSSASISLSEVLYSGSSESNISLGEFETVSTNSGEIKNSIKFSNIQFDGTNSISSGAIGSTSSFSQAMKNYSADNLGDPLHMGNVNFSGSNTGSIYFEGGMSGTAITGGKNTTVSQSAMGSAQSFSFP